MNKDGWVSRLKRADKKRAEYIVYFYMKYGKVLNW